jgi:hypothetical protein
VDRDEADVDGAAQLGGGRPAILIVVGPDEQAVEGGVAPRDAPVVVVVECGQGREAVGWPMMCSRSENDRAPQFRWGGPRIDVNINLLRSPFYGAIAGYPTNCYRIALAN